MTKKTSVYRSFFIHPATWAILAILMRSISLLIQGVDPIVFEHAAAPLLIIQTLFTLMAGVMVVGIASYLVYRMVRYGCAKDSDIDDIDEEACPKNPNVIFKYLSETLDWTKPYPWAKPLFFVVLICSLLTAFVLIVGYFTDGFGLFPGSFSFMGPVFDFMISGFLASAKAVFALPGLGFLDLASDAGMMITAQAVSIAMCILASFLVPITCSRILNTLLGGDEGKIMVVSELDVDMDEARERSIESQEKEEGEASEGCDFCAFLADVPRLVCEILPSCSKGLG